MPPAYLITLAKRRPARIIGVAALIVGAAVLYNAVHGPRYTASMRVLVAQSAASLVLAQPAAEAAAATLLVPDHGQAARNLGALLNDPGLVRRMLPAASTSPPTARWTAALSAAAARLGLVTPLDPDQAFDARLARNFTATALGDTDVLRLDLTWDDPRIAAQTLAAIASGAARAVSGAGEARATLAQAQTRLRAAQEEADALEDAAHAVPPKDAARQKAAIAARLAAATASADQIRVALELARRGEAATDTAYRGGGWVGATEGGKLAKSFADLLQQKQTLSAAATQDAGAIGEIDGKIAQLREQNYRHVRARYADEVAAQTASLAKLQSAIADDQAALRTLDAQDAQAQVIGQARAAKAAALAAARAGLRRAQERIDGAWQEVGAIRVLSQARAPAEPDWPAPPLVLRIAILAGLAAGMVSAALAERGRRTIDYPDDITRRLGIEVLGRLAEQPAGRAR